MIDVLEDLEVSPIFNVTILHSHSTGTNDDQMNDEQHEKEKRLQYSSAYHSQIDELTE